MEIQCPEGSVTCHRNDAIGHLRKSLFFIISSAVLFTLGLIFREYLHRFPSSLPEYALFLTSYLLAGWKVLWNAVRNTAKGRVFDENFLMTVATIGAILIHELPEAVGVMLFFGVGMFLQDLSVNRSRRSIKALLDIRPDYANLRVDGDTRKVSPDEVKIGDVIVVKPGEKVPLDGEVIEGTSTVDTSTLTGESVPRRIGPGDTILSGMINQRGLITVRVTKVFGESSVSKILHLVENASSKKAETERFITRFAHYYTPAVVSLAAAIAIIPPLFLPDAVFSEWIYRALVLLVISCPCALVISIPLAYFGGIGKLSREGILVKGANLLDALTRVDTAVFDKTGTLTRGAFRVTEIVPRGDFKGEELLRLSAEAEAHSNHPIAQSILEAYGEDVDESTIEEYEEIAAHGVKARVEGRAILLGNDRLLHSEDIEHDTCEVEGTVAHVVVNGRYAGYLIISDQIKGDARETITALKGLGVKKAVMLTGDNKEVAKSVAARVGIDTYFAELLPENKVEILERLEGEKQPGEVVVFVGDGINDAPVIARADIGVAMGGLGSDAAVEIADVVIMTDAPSKLPTAIKVARRTRLIVWQNILFALLVKGAFIGLGTIGIVTIWEAVFADVGVALLAIFNATRISK